MNPSPRNRMPWWLATLLLASGLIFALIGLIPVVGLAADFMSWILFSFVFYIRGASFTKSRKTFLTLILSLGIGLIPEIGDFISDIVGLALQIHFVRKEDKEFNAALRNQY